MRRRRGPLAASLEDRLRGRMALLRLCAGVRGGKRQASDPGDQRKERRRLATTPTHIPQLEKRSDFDLRASLPDTIEGFGDSRVGIGVLT